MDVNNNCNINNNDYGNMYCNLKTCHKLLDNGYAWITSCFHIYCNEDGEKYFVQSNMCPLCNRELDPKKDLIRIKLNPTEQYKSLILCGQSPHVIMQVSTNALRFWSKQLLQENDYNSYLLERERDKRFKCESNESIYEYKLKQMQKQMDDLRRENDLLKGVNDDSYNHK